jgi:hypothetical protein
MCSFNFSNKEILTNENLSRKEAGKRVLVSDSRFDFVTDLCTTTARRSYEEIVVRLIGSAARIRREIHTFNKTVI